MLTFEYPYPESVPSKGGGRVPFRPESDASHRAVLERQIERWRHAEPRAAGAVIDHIDSSRRVAVLVDKTLADVRRMGDDALTVNLSDEQMRPSSAQKVRAFYEQQYPGFTMTAFRPYLGKAVFERMEPERVAARAQVAAELGVKEWMLRVDAMPDGGWRVSLDDGLAYRTSMEPALERACTALGGPGWWHETHARSGVVEFHPGEPPTFLPSHEYPWRLLGAPECRDRTPFAVRLPRTGGADARYEDAWIDWRESSFLLVGGEGGTGKSVLANGILASIVAQRAELTIVDLNNKATDYFWLRPWVTYWGCRSDARRAGVVNTLVREIEHGERARVWEENAWQNWLDIPAWAKREYPLHYIVVDEWSSIVDKAKDATRIPDPEKTLPAVLEKAFTGQAQAQLKDGVLRMLRTARAQGYRLILLSQTISDRSGLGPTVRDLFGHHIVMGPSPSKAMVESGFHDPSSVPDVPVRLFEDGVTKGVGRAELQGARPFVFKTYWAGRDGMSDTEALGRYLAEHVGLPDDVDADAYADTLRRHGEDDPADGRFMNFLTERVEMSEEKAIASDPILAALHQAWMDSRACFGLDGEDSAPASRGSESGEDDGGVEPRSDDALRDARELARVMRAG